MNPGSKVNTPCSLVRFEISSASGPMVPETAFIGVVLPVARFLSSYFVLMLCSDRGVRGGLGGSFMTPQRCTAVHRNQGSGPLTAWAPRNSRAHAPRRARTGARIHARHEDREAGLARENLV